MAMGRLLTAIGLLTLAACAGPDPRDAAPPPLAGTSWILTGVAGDRGIGPAIDASGSLTLGGDGSLAGSTGCNRFTGTWAGGDGRLALRPGPMTMMACPGPLGEQESRVLSALAATESYTAADGVLTLLRDGSALAVYRAAVSDLAGTNWSATGVNNGRGGVVTTTGTAQLSLAFAADGTVSGFDGCGPFTGTFATEGGQIRIEAEPTDSCDDLSQRSYLAALTSATTWRVDGNRLELRDDAGALQVGLVQE